MLDDPGSIGKINGALDKIADALEKCCDVRLAESTSQEDVTKIITYIDQLAATKQNLSLMLPPP